MKKSRRNGEGEREQERERERERERIRIFYSCRLAGVGRGRRTTIRIIMSGRLDV